MADTDSSKISREEYELLRDVCHENIEPLHNLVFLLRQHRTQPEDIDIYATTMQSHLEAITNVLCRLPPAQSDV